MNHNKYEILEMQEKQIFRKVNNYNFFGNIGWTTCISIETLVEMQIIFGDF